MDFKNSILLPLLLALFLPNSKAQDIHFSQYAAFAPNLNPALTGFLPIENNVRVAAIVRDQWSSILGRESYRTTGVSIDMRNCFFDDNRNGFNSAGHKKSGPTWGLGLSYIRDVSGVRSVKDITSETFPLVRNYLQLSSSIILRTSDVFYLNVGFRARGTFNRLATAHLRFDEQFDGLAGFDGRIIGEFGEVENLTSQLFDMGAGLAAFYFGKRLGLSGGLAIDRIIRPVRHNFTDDEPIDLARRISLDAKVSYTFVKSGDSAFGINAKGLFVRQNPYEQWIYGADLFFQNGEYFSVAAGLALRSTQKIFDGYHVDAAIASLSFLLDKFTLGVSYDLNVSGLNLASNARGAIEVSLIYHFKRTSKCSPAKIGCPQKGENKVHPLFI